MKKICTTSGVCQPRARGVALALVLAVIALAVVMGTAILASATLQAQSKGNAAAAAEAQYLAESGINLAIYYLQHPEKAPALSSGVYPGQTGISFGASVPGTVDVAVTPVSNDVFLITSTGSANASAANPVTRQVKARVQVRSNYVISKAASFGGSFTIPDSMSIDGDVRSDGVLTKSAGATLNGSILANGSNVSGWSPLPGFPTRAAPSRSDINIYNTLAEAIPYYNYTDSAGTHQGTPQVLSGPVSGTLTPDATNPMNVWYCDTDLTLGDCNVNGTIILRGKSKKLTVDGDAQINAHSGMPAVLVSSSIQFQADSNTKSLTVDGLCWTGGSITTTGGAATNCTVQINGALMMAGAAPEVNSDFQGSISVTYMDQKVLLPNFSNTDRIPDSVKILSWGN